MLKTFLMIAASGGCILIGLIYSERLRRRHFVLEAMLLSLKQMEMLIQYSALPLCAIIEKLIHIRGAGEFWEALGSELKENVGVELSWEKAMKNTRENGKYICALKEEECRILSEFAENLGKSDRTNQLSNIKMAQERLQVVLSGTSKASLQKGKMYRSLGILSAAAVAILLW